jgi:hypothetical protein
LLDPEKKYSRSNQIQVNNSTRASEMQYKTIMIFFRSDSHTNIYMEIAWRTKIYSIENLSDLMIHGARHKLNTLKSSDKSDYYEVRNP